MGSHKDKNKEQQSLREVRQISRDHCWQMIFRSRTNVHYIVFHLTLADTITCFITLPMETIWKICIGVRRMTLWRYLLTGFSGTEGRGCAER